ncbi:hypothetical protein HLB44_34475 [Aquincola sp. S2]|uniref:Uncharacterized protein n=1 Tax=Pseudaquabacterium terrae TaxID=2732868 RepID=A0ABX2ETY0_9BURK|nr:hypothetical protein [Aquabacterium terrae]NRF72102.1 hypothetical protein [Aquabacterium terrae]
MNPSDDAEDWAAALAGRPRPGTAPATVLEAQLLRAAARSWRPELQAEPAVDAEARLLQAASAAGLLQQRRRWCAGCAERWQRWRAWLGASRAWGGALAAGCVGLVLLLPLLQPPEPEAPTVLRGEAIDGVQLLRDARPQARRDQLAVELEALGASVRRYERLGRFGLDAEWPSPLTPDASARLAQRGFVRGADGSVRIEIEAAP